MKHARARSATAAQASVSTRGCLGLLAGLLLGFALIEGGVVLTADGLHRVLGASPTFTPASAGRVVAGVLLVFMGARLWLLAAGAPVRVTWRQGLASLPGFAVAGWFVVGWAAPEVIGHESATMLVGIMVLEFVIIHASIMLAVGGAQLARRVKGASWWAVPRTLTLLLGAVYSLMAAGISAAFGTIWLFVGFWSLMANKFIADWLAPAHDAQRREQAHLARWGTSAMLYLLLAFGSVMIPVPRLGAISGSSGGGLWEEEPQQAVVMGAVYFVLLAFAELYGIFAGGDEAQGGNGAVHQKRRQ